MVKWAGSSTPTLLSHRLRAASEERASGLSVNTAMDLKMGQLEAISQLCSCIGSPEWCTLVATRSYSEGKMRYFQLNVHEDYSNEMTCLSREPDD